MHLKRTFVLKEVRNQRKPSSLQEVGGQYLGESYFDKHYSMVNPTEKENLLTQERRKIFTTVFDAVSQELTTRFEIEPQEFSFDQLEVYKGKKAGLLEQLLRRSKTEPSSSIFFVDAVAGKFFIQEDYLQQLSLEELSARWAHEVGHFYQTTRIFK